MKLFKDFEAVKFPEEDMIFVTHNGYLYYIYNPKYKVWRKHRNAGNDHITVSNYQDISRAELEAAMNGVFPKKETDFMRLCNPEQLCIRDMLDLFREDYANYMSDYSIYHTVHEFLLESSICYTIDAFSSGRKTEYTQKLKETNTKIELIIDFYRRFIYRMEYMMCVGKEKGFDLISFMGP